MKKLITLLTILFITTLSFAQYDTLRLKSTNGVGQEVKTKFTIRNDDLKIIKHQQPFLLQFIFENGIDCIKRDFIKYSAGFEIIPNTINKITIQEPDQGDSICRIYYNFYFKSQNGYGNYITSKITMVCKYNIKSDEIVYDNHKIIYCFIDGELYSGK